MPNKTITISLETWQELMRLKVDLNAESLDAIVKQLLRKSGSTKSRE